MKYKKVNVNTAAEIKILYQIHHIRGKELLEKFPGYSKANIYKHARKPIGADFCDSRKKNSGRPRKISAALNRRITREVASLAPEGFTSKDIQANVGVVGVMSNRTIRRALNRNGLKWLRLRQKGVLLEEDLEKRLKFARRCKKELPDDFWKTRIGLYLDGVGFEWKKNPHKSVPGTNTMGWRCPGQGLDIHQTRKGKKEGKKNANFYVGISYGKGVVTCQHYVGQMNAERYEEIVVPGIKKGIQLSEKEFGKYLLQDNCRIMNARLIKSTLENDLNIEIFEIPARSPDINCIENVFHEMRKAIQLDAVKKNIVQETFTEFVARCKSIITKL